MTIHSCYFCGTALTPEDERCTNRGCRRQQLLRDRFRIVRIIGQGGYGTVFEVFDELFDVKRAIKRITADSLSAQKQIQDEVKILAKHARTLRFIPEIYDVWHENADTFLVMEFIEGVTLGQTLKEQGEWSPVGVEHFLRTLLGYLADMEHVRLVHRDLKPDNIKQTSDGRFVLLDFGIAKHGDVTSTGIRGAYSRFFAPPEQIQSRPTDTRSDLYSLGATAYALLTGGSYLEDSADRLRLGVPLHPPSFYDIEAPEQLESVIMSMLELDPADRPQSPDDALQALEETPGLRRRINRKNVERLTKLARISGTTILTSGKGYPLPEVSISPNNSALLLLQDTNVELWDIVRRSCVASIDTTDAHNRAYCWSNSGEQIAITLKDGAVSIWNAAGSMHSRATQVDAGVHEFIWSPDDQWLTVVANDGRVYLYATDNDTDNRVMLLDCEVEMSFSVAWSMDSHQLATLARNNTIYIWNHARERTLIIDPGRKVRAIRWANQNSSYLCALVDHEICIWSRDGIFQQTMSIADPEGLAMVRYILFGDSYPEIIAPAALNGDNPPQYLEVISEKDSYITLGIQDDSVYCTIPVDEEPRKYFWNNDHTILALIFSNGVIRLWHRSSQTYVDSWSADSRVLVVSTLDRPETTAASDKDNQSACSHTTLVRTDGTFICSLADSPYPPDIIWSPDDQQFCFCNYENLLEGTIGICSSDGTTATIEELGELYDFGWTPDSRNLILEHTNGNTLLFTIGGKYLGETDRHSAHGATICSADGSLLARVRRKDYNAELVRIDGQWNCVLPGRLAEATISDRKGIAWNPRNKLVAVGLANGEVKLWNTSGSLWSALVDHHDAVYDVDWSPDGRLLETRSVTGEIHVWNIEGSPRRLPHLRQNSGCWSPGWQVLAMPSEDGIIEIYARDGTLRSKLRNGSVGRPRIFWSPNERMLALWWDSGIAQIWNTTGTCHCTLGSDTAPIHRIAWSPNSQIVYSEDSNHQVTLWDTSGRALRRLPNWPSWSSDSRLIGMTVDGILTVWGIASPTT